MSEEIPFSEVLTRLQDPGGVTLSLLYRLSDMMLSEFEAFSESWQEWPEKRRRVIARHMADISEENYVVDFAPVFVHMLMDEAAEVRLAALDGLWDSSNLTAVEPIIGLMQTDLDSQVRAAAAATLGHYVLMGEWGQINERVSGRIVDALLAQFDRDEELPVVRRAVLESLGNAAHTRIPGLIENAYHTGNETMRMSAVYAMGRTADRRWAPLVIEELFNEESEMRVEAARAAGNLGISDAVDRLIELLHDEELEVQLATITALGQIGNEEAFDALQELAQDPRTEDELLETIEEALEEIEWMGGELDLALFEWDEDEDLD